MKSSLFFAVMLALSGSLLVQPSQAQVTFDPHEPCENYLPVSESLDKAVVGQWVSGYLAGLSGAVSPTSEASNDRLVEQLNATCIRSPQASLLSLVETVFLGNSKSTQSTILVPGSPADGRAMLELFFRPDTDFVALTASLRPAPDDIRTIYAEPLASALIDAYESAFAPGAAIRPKPEQTELLATFTTTFELKNGGTILDSFPGGYGGVLEYFVTDTPIARFKFVEPGKTSGFAFDGFIFVNQRWVLMPKPWRGLN